MTSCIPAEITQTFFNHFHLYFITSVECAWLMRISEMLLKSVWFKQVYTYLGNFKKKKKSSTCAHGYRKNCVLQPEMTPLVNPGMPCNSVTLLLAKYSLHVALRWDPSQKRLHSWVVTVMLSITSVLLHLSNWWFFRVRFPNMHTLCEGREKC